MKVIIDGTTTITDFGDIVTMPDLIEYVKANIDPETIIIDLSIGGRALTDADWHAPLSVQGESTLDITTGTKEDYLSSRFESSVTLLDHIINEFAAAREHYQSNDSTEGNTQLTSAVKDLNAFLNWYATLLTMLPPSLDQQANNFNSAVEDLKGVCEQLLQQQLYQSWWAIGETLEKKLEPNLTSLKESCEEFAGTWS